MTEEELIHAGVRVRGSLVSYCGGEGRVWESSEDPDANCPDCLNAIAAMDL